MTGILAASLAAIGVTVLAGLTGCAADPTSERQPPTTPAAAAEAPSFDDLVEASGGRTLATTCWGDGSPTVVYLHGLLMPRDGAGWAHAPELRTRLRDEATFCEYERANVGRSSKQDGPIPIEDTLADLDAVLDGIEATSPVILVGGSFGGLVASTYAGTRPDRVAGVVLLDPSLPGSNALEAEYLPPEFRLTPEAWDDSAEKIDVFAADLVAVAALETLPAIPGTVFVTESMELPPANEEAFLAALRAQQADVAARFSPGELVTVDAPHAMVPVVPDEISDAIRAVIGEAGLGGD